MDYHVFRLQDRTSKAFHGIAVIFATQPRQEVWKRLVTDDRAEEVPHIVAHNEVTTLSAELAALTDGKEIREGGTLLRQMFDDRIFGRDILAVFAERGEFPMIVSRSDQSFRMRIETRYEQMKP
jgi:hypothetical protein